MPVTVAFRIGGLPGQGIVADRAAEVEDVAGSEIRVAGLHPGGHGLADVRQFLAHQPHRKHGETAIVYRARLKAPPRRACSCRASGGHRCHRRSEVCRDQGSRVRLPGRSALRASIVSRSSESRYYSRADGIPDHPLRLNAHGGIDTEGGVADQRLVSVVARFRRPVLRFFRTPARRARRTHISGRPPGRSG